MKTEKIYDFLKTHSTLRHCSIVVLSLALCALVCSIRFSENIGDFLPTGTDDREALEIYQSISGADGLYILFSNPDNPDRTVEAMEAFADKLYDADNERWCESYRWNFNLGNIQEVSDFVYDNIPYFLTDRDYSHIDSLLQIHGYIEKKIANDREALMLPTGSIITNTIRKDPLSLFSNVLSELNRDSGFERYGGCIFTPDMSRAVAMMNSPFGNSETENNGKLLKLLRDVSDSVEEDYPDVHVSVIGGPAIAVGNSERIKKDSVIAIALSAILIIIILASSFNSLKNILLIFLTIGWGMLFAMGGIALLRDRVSIIVIGISSIILGIAVNYPLHLIAHSAHQHDMRKTLSEISYPLVIGNITTVGAFLALVPLKSAALRDLGLFSSLLLVGTILFVLVWLPHYVKTNNLKERKNRIADYLSKISPDNSKLSIIAVAVITAVLLPFSFRTEFDSDISNINYVTDDQRTELQYFENLMAGNAAQNQGSVYIYSSGADFDSAIEEHDKQTALLDSLSSCGLIKEDRNATRFITTKAEQQRRLEKWRSFCAKYGEEIADRIKRAAATQGFRSNAFECFITLLDGIPEAKPQDFEYFSPLSTTVFRDSFTSPDGSHNVYVVDVLNVSSDNTEQVKKLFKNSFDVAGMSGKIAGSLSDNFNYIGLVCSLIVFFFLWFSFGRIELALISFLPMAVSWVWILGLMTLLGVKFNIVNIILATFIFGQGDDYTIFMTEGCQYEYANGKKILESYKSSIIQSALIMFAGIGTLIVARHPAMRSLAEVTIIGMFSVVLMAYMLPPLLFRLLTRFKGKPRVYPITIERVFFGKPGSAQAKVKARYCYKGNMIMKTVHKNMKLHAEEIIKRECGTYVDFNDPGYGELSILLALTHPGCMVRASIKDEKRLQVARISASGFVDNIEFVQ